MKSKVMLSVLLLTCMALNVNLAWGAETLVETVGFESSEGYTSSTTYNSANYTDTVGTSGSKWTINYGAFSTSSAIVGSQSAQFRVYSAGNYGQLRNTVAYEIDITKVVFNARVSNTNSSIKVSYSADGTSWTDIETVSFSGTTMVEHTSTISVSGARYIKFTAAGTKPSSGNYQIYIDAVKIYTASGVTYTDYLTECESCDSVDTELSVTATQPTLTIGSNDQASTTLSTTGGNGGTVKYSVTPNTANITDNSITFTAAGTYIVTASQEKTADGKCSQSATVTITVNPRQYTLTFVDRGTTFGSSQLHIAGEKATNPGDPTGVCTDPINYVFDGWAEKVVTGEPTYTKVDFDTYTMPAKDTQLYAVYRYADEGSGATSMFLLSETSSSTEYYIGKKNSTGEYFDAVTNMLDAIPFGIEDGKYLYTVIDGVKTYISHTSNGETELIISTTSKTAWNVTDNGTTIKLNSTTQSTRYLGYGTGFRAYAASHTLTKTAAPLYTTSPTCGPHVGVSGDVRITSAKGVRVDAYTKISVRATNLDKNTGGDGGAATAVSIKAESSNPNFKIKRWGITGDGTANSLTLATNITAANYEDSLCITYTPTTSNTTESATITLTAYKYNGTTPYATNTITVQGHSLPERFVIAAQSATGWVALPNTLGSSSSATVPNAEDISNDVDPSANPTKLTTAPSNVIYTAAARADAYKNNSQTGLRFTVDGTQFLQASKSDTKVWLPTNNAQYMQSWTLRTEDFVNYQARLDSADAGRYLAYNKDATTERIGHYKANTPIRFLPFDAECTRLLAPTNLKVTQVKSNAITLTWDAVTGATGYAYSTDDGNTWTEMGNVLTYTITGLTAGTAYTIWVKGVVPAGDTDCSYYGTVSATTSNCDDVPYDISYTSDANSITLSWTMSSATATVQVFSDAEGTTQVGSDYTGKTSPCTITGLTKATTYYVKILADGTCSSALVDVSTERPQLDVVEWKSNGIDVAINTNEKISVVLENQVTKGTGTGLIADELFFSKYFEATGNVKLLAVYNGTGHDVDVTNYTIKYGKNSWESGYIKLGNFTEVSNTMAAGEEVILYSTQSQTNDTKIMDCVSAAYPDAPWQEVTAANSGASGLLSFAGDKTIALYNGTTLLDVIGAITSEGSPTNTGASMKKPSWGDANGWTCETGLSIEDGTEIGISTNRCLLVRKNTVKSGANAVAQNTADFATLCDEWFGQHVPDTADNGVQASCDNFAYVGTFDYSGYYTTYDSLTTVDFDNSKRNPDGTLTINIPRMDTLACRGLKIIAADESGNVLTTKDYKVPILVTTDATTADELFSHFGGDTCKTCDVVVRDNATLTKAADGTASDKPQVRDVKIYEGASLVVPSGTNYTVNSLSFRRKEDAVAFGKMEGGILTFTSISPNPVHLDLLVNAENWHWFTLPYNCAIADVTWSNGQAARVGADWLIATYNGQKRAATQAGGCWEDYAGDTIYAGQGYIVGIAGDANHPAYTYELRFPMAKEVIGAEANDKDVTGIKAYGAGTSIRPNHKGWNLVGNPYLNYYQKGNINSFDGLQLSKLIYDDVTGWWSLGTDNLPYVVIPINGGWSAYQQVLVSAQDLLPFTAYFIQVGKEGDTDRQDYSVNFTSAKRGKSAKAALLTRAATESEEPVITGITLSNALGESDETSLVIADRFTTDYEMGADFFKWFGDYYKYYTRPVLYTIGTDAGKRAFNALPENAAQQPIAVGFFAAQAGTYTFSLNRRSDLSRVAAVWLYDATTNTHTDLLTNDYTFTTAKTETATRFTLSVNLLPKVVTGCENIDGDRIRITTSGLSITLSGLPSEAQLWLYDATGKLLIAEQTHNYRRTYMVPQTGVYFVRVESNNGTETLRTVVR